MTTNSAFLEYHGTCDLHYFLSFEGLTFCHIIEHCHLITTAWTRSAVKHRFAMKMRRGDGKKKTTSTNSERAKLYPPKQISLYYSYTTATAFDPIINTCSLREPTTYLSRETHFKDLGIGLSCCTTVITTKSAAEPESQNSNWDWITRPLLSW